MVRSNQMITKVYFKDLPNTKAPVLDYCRVLIKQGKKPNTKLEVYRDRDIPDVIVKNIGEAAKWTVEENATSGPRFIKYKEFPKERFKESKN